MTMFKFDFGKNNSIEDKDKDADKKELEWFPVCEIDPAVENDMEESTTYFTEKEMFPDVKLKFIQSNFILNKLKNKNCNYILEAESQHSDLLPSKYEGGLKIWECTYDLGNYLLQQNYELKSKLVLDLGCGVGIIGLLALMKGAEVHFQDYNKEIIKYATIPNVKQNSKTDISEKCKFYSGDWESFTNTLNNHCDTETKKYDYIFTSETIYNPDNHIKLFNVFKYRLKKGGLGLIAGKTHYFGVGGGMRQFETIVKQDKNFKAEIVWNSDTGLQREILKITRL